MSLVVVEVPPTTKLTTLEKVKRALGITVVDSDEELSDLIQAASDFACRYCGRTFALHKVREGLPGKGTNDILLSLTPIVDIDLLEYNGDEVDGASYSVSDAEAGIVQSSLGFRGSYYANPNSWHDHPSTEAKEVYFFTYDGGYVLPGWGESHGARTLPYDLERAIIDTVVMHFKAGGSGGSGGIVWDGQMSSYKVGDTMITWGKGGSGSASGSSGDGGVSSYFPARSLAVLNWYRRAY